MKELHNSCMQNMDEISNDGMNSDLDEHDDDDDDDEFGSSFNRSKANLDDDLLFNNSNNNNSDSNLMNNNEINFNASSKRKRISSSKYCKKRKCRTTFTKSQLVSLENEFLKSNFVSNDRIDLLIELTGLDSRIIKNWFKNKRSRVLADSKTNISCSKVIGSSDSHSLSSPSPFSIKAELNINQLTPLSTATDPINQISPGSISSTSTTINQLFVQTSNLVKEATSCSKVPYSINKTNNFLNSETLTTDLDSNHYSSVHSSPASHEMKSNGLLNIFSNNSENELPKPAVKSINPMPNVLQTSPVKQHVFKTNSEILRKQNLNYLLEMKDSSCLVCSRFSKLFCICNVSKTALNRLYRNYAGFNGIFHQHDNLKQKYQIDKTQRLVINDNETKVYEIL